MFTQGTRLAWRNSRSVIGRASGSAAAAASICAGVIARMGTSGKAVSLPSFETLTTFPSGRILAVVVVLLMAFGLARGDDADTLFPTLGVCHTYEDPLAHADQVNALLSIVLAIIDVLDRKGIMEGLDRLMKRHTVITPVGGARRRRSISALEIR